MHPAPSVIVFTTFSGLGFGLLFWLGLGQPDPTGWVAFAFFALAYVMAVGGLLASLFHLGHPERAHLALTQWRSSWLSREGVAAIATLTLGGLFAVLRIFALEVMLLGWLVSLGCLATVFTTSMIYTQMRTVPRWRHWTTPALFLTLSLAGGALLAGRGVAAGVLLCVAAILQLIAWWRGDASFAASGTTLASATGLGTSGTVRSFMPPHTGSNYLLREFAYVVGRRHAVQLRVIGFALAFVLPAGFALTGLTHVTALVAVASHLTGVLCLRWLFFAQAEHVVGLYYGVR